MILRIELLQQELTNYKMLTVNPLTVMCALGNSNPLFYKASEISEISFSPLFFTFIL